MIAIILAAGTGNRMQPLTFDTHKTLLKVNEKCIIEHIIDSLILKNINKIYIVTGYKSEELKSHIQEKYKSVKIKYIHNDIYDKTNNIFSLSLALDNINLDDCILIESDLVYNHKIIDQLIKNDRQNVALVSKYEHGLDGTVVELDSNSKIVNVIPTHLQTNYVNLHKTYKTINIYKFSKSFLEKYKIFLSWYSKSINDNCYYELILGLLIYMKEVDIYADVIDISNWSEVDTPNDLELCDFKFSNKKLDILEKNFGGYWKYSDLIDFNFIRNMYYPPIELISDMQIQLPNLLQNYGSKFNVINKKLSYFLLENENNICVLNGLSQIYPLIRSENHRKSLIPTPTFGEYTDISNNIITYSDSPGYDYDDIQNKMQEADDIYIINPNNPTGTLFDRSFLEYVLLEYPTKMFIIDESFIDFSKDESITSYTKKHNLKNVIILKSLSKVIGMPGLRLGYAFSLNESFIQLLKNTVPIWNNNSIAEYYLEMTLKYKINYKKSIEQTKIDINEFSQMLNSIKEITVFSTEANYILISLSKKYDYLQTYLLDKNLLIKDVTHKFDDPNNNYYRIAVRTKEENKKLFVELKRFFVY